MINSIKTRSKVWLQLHQKLKVWQLGALPGLAIVAGVALVRLTGALQTLEWNAFDAFLRLRPIEESDARVVIVGINEADIQQLGDYPIPDRDLANLLTALKRYQPRVIGLDLFRDLTRPDRSELATVLKTTPNLIGIEAALSQNSALQVKPPPELPLERIGLVDTLLDPDGKLRRSLLASKVDSGVVRYSLPLLLAKTYLTAEGIPFQPGTRASEPIRFGSVQLPRFRPNTGSYIRARAGGNQILLNFRSHPQPFPVVSVTEVLQGKVKPEQLHDRIVLIGTTAVNSLNDTFFTSATKGTLLTSALGDDSSQYQLIYGVEHLAHATSQIISAVLDRRSFLRSWAEGWEYAWILSWGVGGVALGLLLQSPWKTLLGIGISSAGLVSICYGLLSLSWWVPVVPTLIALWGGGLTTALFDQRSRDLLNQHNLILKRTYDEVHNGPLQTIAALLRSLGPEAVSADWLRSQLQGLNQELRSVYELMNQSVWSDDVYAETPLPELLYQAYEATISRDLPGFATLKILIPPDFSALQDCVLTAAQVRGVCTFLQEALCNVGKHAVGATRLDVTCIREKNRYNLHIIDNGLTVSLTTYNSRGGRGTSQAEELAQSLRGTFQRRSRQPHGTICELTWPATKRWWI